MREPEEAIYESIVAACSRHTPRSRAEIDRAVRDDYGELGGRRLLRYIRSLVGAGILVRIPFGDERNEHELGYPVYVLARNPTKTIADLIPVQRYVCSECGMTGTTRKSHPEHRIATNMRWSAWCNLWLRLGAEASYDQVNGCRASSRSPGAASRPSTRARRSRPASGSHPAH